MKKGSSNTILPVAKFLFWLAILAGSIVILVWLMLRLAGESPAVVPYQNPIPVTSTPSNPLIFSENFEDGSADGFKNKTGLWMVVSETNGNKVLDANSMGLNSSSETPSIEFEESDWEDFVFESRVNMIDYSPSNDAPLMSIIFRGEYRVTFTPYWKSVNLVHTPPWTDLVIRQIGPQKNIWYSIRIEAKGSQINIFLNDQLIINEKVSHISSGIFGFATWSGVHIQYDDISIKPTSQ